ncbi:hypothetical protein [Flavobacterium phragmitis]|uniref:Uncharacterized protein n=1 Tax=Flavobacterium phragmitis TaxID=739143 RepID=A0A1I1RUL5_9FLAO|nr:hypothetical protein [Flavobacterium phragmitis]SFD38026.1 hypothetical protein SAMN05216297_107168 [Flavobacterium phragmitis]
MKKKIDFLSKCVFIRKIDVDIDTEFKTSGFNNLFRKVVENANPNHKYEVLRFAFDSDKNVLKFGRIITEDLIRSSYQFHSVFEKVDFLNNEICFQTNLYKYRTTNFNSEHFLDLTIVKENLQTKKINNIKFNMLIL